MAIHSNVLAWRIPGTGETGGLPSMGSHGVGHDWSDFAAAASGWRVGTRKGWETEVWDARFGSVFFIICFTLNFSTLSDDDHMSLFCRASGRLGKSWNSNLRNLNPSFLELLNEGGSQVPVSNLRLEGCTFGNFLYPFNSQPWGCHLTDPPVSSCFVSSPRSGQPIPGDAPLELPERNSSVRFRNTSGLPREDRALEWASRSTWFWSLGGALEDSGLSPDKHPCVRRKDGRLGRAWRAPLWARATDRLLLASVSPSALGELSSYLLLQKWFPPPHIALIPSLPHIKSWFFFLGWI